MNEQQTPHSRVLEVVEREGISAVWLVPMIALMFGGWLLIKAIAERGVYITVQFESASGIKVDKTEVRFKGLTLGKVKGVEVTPDLQSVQVEIEMINETESTLTENAQFWFVTADVSLQGIKGLDTLLSGSYIEMQPDITGEGLPQRSFIALKEKPPLDSSKPGLHVSLQSNTLGSLDEGSPVSFKQIQVGHVSSYNYDEQLELVNINIFIEPEHEHLVKKNSRFWNASGLHISGSITGGIDVHVDSMASIISGGVAFDNMKFDGVSEPAKNGDTFQLFDDFKDAEMGHEITLSLGWDADIDRGAPIIYQGVTVGKVENFLKIDPQLRSLKAIATVDPRIVQYLTDESQFYIESPTIDLGGINNLHQMLTGSHIVIRPSLAGEPKSEFEVYLHKPPYKYTEPGLHLILSTHNIESIHPGTRVFYKEMTVGSVQAVDNVGPDNFLVHIFIKPEYQHYVSDDSRFWHASGFSIKGGLRNFEVQAQSMQSVLTGGIAFDIGKSTGGKVPTNGDIYGLYRDKTIAKQRVEFELVVPSTNGIKIGTRIMYRGENIGSIHEIQRHEDKVVLHAGVLPDYQYVLREGTKFWQVDAKLSLSGLTDVEALFGGDYFTFHVGDGEPQLQFVAYQTPPPREISSPGLQLVLTNNNNTVSPGTSVSYRGIVVGQVDNVSLDKDGSQVIVNLTIDDSHRHLITPYTRFYNASGLTLSGGLGNFVVKTESIDTLLAGGISFYNPKLNDLKQNQEITAIKEGDHYTLFNSIEHARSAGIAITIDFNDIAGLRQHLPIKYQDQKIGFIERLDFDADDFGAKVFAYLNDNGRKFAVQGTKFWLAQPELGLVGSTNVKAILDGGFINILPGSGGQQTHFKGEDIAPVVSKLPYGLNVKLVTDRLGSVRVGNPVLYRQVKVGKVIGVDLSQTADTVDVYINIAQRYAPLVTTGSKFWNTSGFNLDAGVFSGVNIESESIEAILAGGIAFATPDTDEEQASIAVTQGHQFKLYQELDDDWQDWRPQIVIQH